MARAESSARRTTRISAPGSQMRPFQAKKPTPRTWAISSRKRRAKPEEVVAKLRQADVLIAQGQIVADVIRTLGLGLVRLAGRKRRVRSKPRRAARWFPVSQRNYGLRTPRLRDSVSLPCHIPVAETVTRLSCCVGQMSFNARRARGGARRLIGSIWIRLKRLQTPCAA